MNTKIGNEMHKKYKNWILLILLILLIILFFTVVIICGIFKKDDLFYQIISILLGSIITISMTAILLQQQTDEGIKKACSEKIFENKTTVYHNFLKELHALTEKEKTTINHKEIIQKMTYHLGLLQMHLDQESIKKITRNICEILATDRNNNLHEYKKVADNYFEIASLLGDDLYSTNLERKSGKKNSYNFAKTIAVIFDKELREQKSMVELHKQWWKIFKEELKKKNKKLDLSQINDDYINRKIEEFEDKDNAHFIFDLKGNYKNKAKFFIEYNFESPLEYGLENENNEKLQKKSVDEKYDIDFFYTNFNYYAFASADEKEKRTLLKLFVNEINKDIKCFIKKLQ